MATIIPPQPPQLYPKQRAAIDDPARYVVIDASTKAGKTVGCLSWIYRQAIAGSDRKCLWVAPIYETAKTIGYQRMRKMLSGSDPEQKIWTPRDADLEIRFANGSVIRFKGSDNPDSIYGEDYHAAVIDEASRCKEGAWHAVRSTLTATRGPIRLIGNVKGRKNWAYRLGQLAKSGTEGMAYHKLTAYDAVEGGVMDVREIEDAKRTLPEAVFRELYLAEPTDDGANPFDLRAIAACFGKRSVRQPVSFGIDLAKSTDWTWVIGLDDAGVVCVSERWQSDWGMTRRRIKGLIRSSPALIDATGVGDPIVEDLIADGCDAVGFKFTAPSKQQIMVGLASALQQGEVGFDDAILRDELESFEFEYRPSGVRYSAPEGLHDDGVCALALAVRHRSESARSDFYFKVG